MKRILFYILTATLTACSNHSPSSDANGVFEATEVIVACQTQGELMQMPYTEGDIVKTTDCIAHIDTIQLALRRNELLAGLGMAESHRYNVNRQIAALKEQIKTQQCERTRFAKLINEHAANQKQLDDIDAQLATLYKQLDAQTETLQNANRGTNEELKKIEAQLAQLDDQIRRCRVHAPINGTILEKYAEQGELAVIGKPLYKIADVKHLYLRAYITAPQLTGLKLGQKLQVMADMGTDGERKYQGRLVWISDHAEFTPKTIQTRDERANLVYAVKVAVQNDGYIKIGMYGKCCLQ